MHEGIYLSNELHRMKKYILVLWFILLSVPVLLAQEGGFGSFSQQTSAQSATETDDEDEYDEEEEAEVSTTLKQRMSFTRRELQKITDPRIRDLYWYALNDTTDKKRYLRAHYAFNEFRDNWAFEFHGGVHTVLVDYIKERFSLGPQFEFVFKKDVHPYWAVRGEVGISKYEKEMYTAHLSTMVDDWTNYPANGSDWWMPVSNTMLMARGSVMLNVVNLMAGREMLYTPWMGYMYFGAGFVYAAKDLSQRDGSCVVPQWYFGVQPGWNFNQRYSFVIDANVGWQSDDILGLTTQNSTWDFHLTMGIAYKFSKTIHFQRLGYDESFTHKTIVDADEGEGDVMQTVIEQSKNTEQVNLPSDLIEAAFFQIDRIELQHTYVLNLGFYAKLIKDHPNQKFLVKGFADIEVGSLKRNEWLSQQRAKVVADVLVKTYGVNPDQLVVGGGELDYEIPFLRENGHHRFNRCTIVCPLNQDYQIIQENTFEDNSELMDGRVAPSQKNY